MDSAIIYSRVSTSKQDNSTAIERLQNYAKGMNYEVLDVFADVITGRTKAEEREEFKRLFEFIEKNHVKHLLLWELSRLGRNLSNILYIIDLLTQKGINVYIDKDGINTLNRNGKPNTMGKLMISILGTLAEIELETFKERSKRGNRANVEHGGAGTGIIKPFGYKKVEKKLVVDEDEAKVVKLIFEKYIDGLGTLQIANHLNNLKIPTKYNKLFGDKIIKTKHGIKKEGNKFDWKEGTVYGILTNSIYKGKRKHKEETFDIEKIVDASVFDEVQLRLSNNNNKKGNNTKYENILKDIIKCGYCDYQYFMHKRANGNDKAYKCTSIRYHKNCGNSGISIDKLNNAVYTLIQHRVKEKFNINEEKITDIKTTIENLIIQINNNLADINKENNKLKVLLEMRLNKELTKESYHEKYEELHDRLKSLAGIQSKLNIELSKNKTLLSRLKNTKMEDLVADISVFKKYVNQVIESIKIYKIQNLCALQKIFTNKQDTILFAEMKIIDGATLPFLISIRTNELYLLYNFEPDETPYYIDYETKSFIGIPQYLKFTIPDIVKI
jgi:DNA invertase Pin-like site-specific DNA recombinase